MTRTWHTQLGIFWIATAWLATGLFMAPAVSGHEPRFQRLGVNFLFVCLLVIVVGSMAGQWLAVQQRLGQRDELLVRPPGLRVRRPGPVLADLPVVGLFLWLLPDGPGDVAGLPAAGREPAPAGAVPARLGGHRRCSTAPALMWHRQTNLAIAEYWRWWVVHLWVEGFFEVFATVGDRLPVHPHGPAAARPRPRPRSCSRPPSSCPAASSARSTTSTSPARPTVVLALGATFSALEVVPLVLIGFEAYENLTLSRARPWVAAYRWPIYFFVAVAFWNLVGAGLFGFLINPPIALYYMQGLNTTPVHGHTALFGVYGMLGIGLMLFCLQGPDDAPGLEDRRAGVRVLGDQRRAGADGAPEPAAGGPDADLGQRRARHLVRPQSAEFMQTPTMDTLRWLRVVGDTIFAAGMRGAGLVRAGPEDRLVDHRGAGRRDAARPTDYGGRAIRVGDGAARRVDRGSSRRLLESHILCVP